MHDIKALLELSKDVAAKAGQSLLNNINNDSKSYVHSQELPKEIKAVADRALEKDILESLGKLGLPILSEESGYMPGKDDSEYYFIIDPLDGTYNFVKGLGPCAVSIALWKDQTPIFGVIYNIVDQELIWGGVDIGAYCNGERIYVSTTSSKSEGAICTGFPVRLNLESESTMKNFWKLVSPYAKVRMLGSAAMSLVYVAKGAAEVYSEKNIMLWDVAAGIAIVVGAGGTYESQETGIEWSRNIAVTNGIIDC